MNSYICMTSIWRQLFTICILAIVATSSVVYDPLLLQWCFFSTLCNNTHLCSWIFTTYIISHVDRGNMYSKFFYEFWSVHFMLCMYLSRIRRCVSRACEGVCVSRMWRCVCVSCIGVCWLLIDPAVVGSFSHSLSPFIWYITFLSDIYTVLFNICSYIVFILLI